jgi:hypothetical protein
VNAPDTDWSAGLVSGQAPFQPPNATLGSLDRMESPPEPAHPAIQSQPFLVELGPTPFGGSLLAKIRRGCGRWPQHAAASL